MGISVDSSGYPEVKLGLSNIEVPVRLRPTQGDHDRDVDRDLDRLGNTQGDCCGGSELGEVASVSVSNETEQWAGIGGRRLGSAVVFAPADDIHVTAIEVKFSATPVIGGPIQVGIASDQMEWPAHTGIDRSEVPWLGYSEHDVAEISLTEYTRWELASPVNLERDVHYYLVVQTMAGYFGSDDADITLGASFVDMTNNTGHLDGTGMSFFARQHFGDPADENPIITNQRHSLYYTQGWGEYHHGDSWCVQFKLISPD